MTLFQYFTDLAQREATGAGQKNLAPSQPNILKHGPPMGDSSFCNKPVENAIFDVQMESIIHEERQLSRPKRKCANQTNQNQS